MQFLQTLSLSILLAKSTLAQDCYWPNGDPAPHNYVRCPENKACCAEGEACLSNQLCYGAKYNIAYRGACIDKSWPEANCSRACYDEIPDGWANLYACPNNTNQVFTCGRPGWAADVCKANLGKYAWAEAHVSMARVSATETSTSPEPSNTNATRTGSPGTTAATSSNNSAVALGAGLGVGLGVPLLLVSVAMLALWVRMRKRSPEGIPAGKGRLHGYDQGPTRGFYDDRPRELETRPVRRELEA